MPCSMLVCLPHACLLLLWCCAAFLASLHAVHNAYTVYPPKPPPSTHTLSRAALNFARATHRLTDFASLGCKLPGLSPLSDCMACSEIEGQAEGVPAELSLPMHHDLPC